MRSQTLLIFVFLLLTAAKCFQFESLNLLSEVKITSTSPSTAEAVSRLIDKKGNVSQHGHVWSPSPNPILGFNSQTSNLGEKATTGEFKSIIRGLQTNTSYFVRAFMIVDNQVVYGPETNFTAGDASIKPNEYLNMLGVADIKNTSATAEAKIEKLGNGSQLTKYGHCWSTAPNPTVNDSKTEFSNNIGLGTFQSNLTGLLPNTTYYIRAYMITTLSNGQAIYSLSSEDKIKTTNN